MRVYQGNALLEKIGLILLTGFLFSVTIACLSIAIRNIPPITLTALRLATATAVNCGAWLLLKPRYRWDLRGAVDTVVIGLLNIGLPFLCLALAIPYISSALAAVLFNTTPVFTILMAHWILPNEKLNAVKVIGTVVVVAGATLLVVTNASGLAVADPRGWIGQLLIVLSSLISALGVIYTRIRLREHNTFVLATGQVFASLVVILPLAIAAEGWPAFHYPWQAWAATLVAAVSGPILGFWLFFYMVEKYTASLTGFTGIATPLFSVIIGVLFLGEVLTAPLVVGMIVLLAGVWSLNYF